MNRSPRNLPLAAALAVVAFAGTAHAGPLEDAIEGLAASAVTLSSRRSRLHGSAKGGRDRTATQDGRTSASLRSHTFGVNNVYKADRIIVDPCYLIVPSASIELRCLEAVGRQENQAAALLARMTLDRCK